MVNRCAAVKISDNDFHSHIEVKVEAEGTEIRRPDKLKKIVGWLLWKGFRVTANSIIPGNYVCRIQY